MSARIPTRRIGQSTLAAFQPRSTTSRITSAHPHRSFSCAFRLKADKDSKANSKVPAVKNDLADVPTASPDDPLSNPLLEKYLRNKQERAARNETVEPPDTRTGEISTTSIFQPEHENPRFHESLSPAEQEKLRQRELEQKERVEAQRKRDLRALVLDPVPRQRLKLERKLVIRNVEKHGRITKAVKIARTEREYVYKSVFLPTSTKKLTRIMHLIAGKTVEEALVQLRFSPKRIAIDVRKALQRARDEAILSRGMGLGGRSAQQAALEAEQQDESEPYLADGTHRIAPKKEGKLIQLKDGSKKRIHDETEMYIDQAWVGPGKGTRSLLPRARGQVNLLKHRVSMFGIILKEEKTRVRLSDEMQKKRDNRKLWVALPDRPVTAQRQYGLW